MKQIIRTSDLEHHKYWDRLEDRCESDNLIAKKYRLFLEFLETELQLNHFIPVKKVDGKWVVLEEPKDVQPYNDDNNYIEFKKAQNNVLFKDCTYELINPKKKDRYYVIYHNESIVWVSWNKSKTIQDLISLDLELTQNAIDKI